MIRPGQKIIVVPGPEWGVRVIQPAAAAADWWDPDNEGLSVVGAYRAINTLGNPWPGGPGVYADTLVNQANPGTFDLVEGNGAVPWAAATGWGFVAAALQYFDTGVVPDGNYTLLFQYANTANNGLIGMWRLAIARMMIRPDNGANQVQYWHAGGENIAPRLLTGNLGVAGQQPYRNGIAEGGPLGPWGAAGIISFYIGALNNGGVAASFLTQETRALVLYDNILTAPQMLAVATAMAAL